MLSKWLPWDFFRNHPKVILNKKGLYAVHSYDAFMERFVLNRLYQNEWNGELRILTAPDITIEWIEENLKTLDLFGGMNSYLILQAENLSSAVIEYLIKENIELESYFILSFVGSSVTFDKLAKLENGNFLKVDEPRFWEGGKLLNFLSEELSVRLPYDVQNYLLGSLPNTTMDLVNALNLIGLHYPKGEGAELVNVKELISPVKLDQFALASLFGQKKRSQFFQKLVEREIDFDSLRGVFSFMQGHLFKLSDPSYVDRKSRPSKYDKEITAHSKLWKEGELGLEMRVFGELEIEAKRKSPHLKDRLRSEYLSRY